MKRIIACITLLSICISFIAAPCFAREFSLEETVAKSLKAMGLFQGVSDTEFELNREPTRVEALVMLIRLLGKEDEALVTSYPHPFTDVPDWADRYVAYAYKAGISKGVSETEFGSGIANAEMYLTFVLRSLGYTDENSADFTWDNPYALAESVGIYSSAVNRFKFLRADVALVSYAALSAKLKNSDTSLGQKLVADGVFSQYDFDKNYNQTLYKEIIPALRELTAEEIYAKCSPAVFYIEVSDLRGNVCGSGSGFFIDSNGTAVTNYHVIEDMHSATITHSYTEEQYTVEGVYDYSIENDWAVIKVSGSGFDFLEFGSPSTVVGGANVYTIGSPMGLQNTISQGIISNTKRVLDGVSYIQTSAPISKGSSGGAFINKYGQVIGITSAGFIDGENLGLCIPISVISGYSTDKLMTVYEAAHGISMSSSDGKYTVSDVLASFVKVYANEILGDSLAYSSKSRISSGYVTKYILLNPDGSLSVAIYSVSGGDVVYFAMDLSGGYEARYAYYTYEGRYGYKFTGEKYLYPGEVTADYNLVFGQTSDYKDLQDHQELASTCLSLALTYVNVTLAEVSSLVPGAFYSVADLGFTSFK